MLKDHRKEQFAFILETRQYVCGDCGTLIDFDNFKVRFGPD